MLSKESILSKVSSYDILNHYLRPYHNNGKLIQGKNISNPLLSVKQHTPSFNIFCSLPEHEWRYKDFATGDEGSCFDLVMKLYNLSYVLAMQKIDTDLCNGLTEIHKYPSKVSDDPKAEDNLSKLFHISIQEFTLEELNFWGRYGITEQTLSRYKVHSLAQYTASNKIGKTYTRRSNSGNFIFCYDHGNWVKLYKPFDEKKYRFQYLGTKELGYLFGYKQLPDHGEIVILTGGEKDVLSLSSHGFLAFTLSSETANLDPQIVTELKSRFKNLIVLYDNDETGLAQSETLSKLHKLKRVLLPIMPNCKDVSDFFASGKSSIDLKNLIDQTLICSISIEEEKFVYDGIEIVEFGKASPQYLMTPIFHQTGTAVLAGKPDTGKSQIARQFCIHVALGLSHFLGLELNLVHKRSIYVATEDGMEACSYLYQQQLKGLGQAPTKNIQFIIADTFEQEEVLKYLDEALTKTPADLVVVDSFGDIFKGFDSNSNMAMRNTVKVFDRIAKKHQCLILFVHHINKSAYRQAPGQEHIQGGAGLVQKVRLAIQLTQGEGFLKYFTVVKGNYCPREYKVNAIELEFSEVDFLFSPTGVLKPIEELGDQQGKDDKEIKTHELTAVADEIFGNKVLSYTAFIQAYRNATGKSIPTAKRQHKNLLTLRLIVECQGGYRLTNYSSVCEEDVDG